MYVITLVHTFAKRISCEMYTVHHRKVSEEHIHREMKNNYYKTKIVLFIINFRSDYAISNGQVQV